ncbi:MAG: M56 family metallopeptidase [Pirellulales bacterium]
MQWLVEVGLSNALAATALALVACIVGRIGRRPAVTHALWVVVLLKLLTPPIFELPLPISIVRTQVVDRQALDVPAERDVAALPLRIDQVATSHADANHEQASIAPPALNHDPVLSAPIGVDANRSFGSVLEAPVASIAQPVQRAAMQNADSNVPQPSPPSEPAISTPPPNTPSWIRWEQLAAMVWLLGLIAWVALQLVLGLRLRTMSRASTPAPVELCRAAEQIARRMGLWRCPQVRIVAGTGSPMLYGLGSRASILIPAALLRRLGAEAQATVLAHELAHYWRGDHWGRLVEVIVTGLYWWLPTVWWARQRIEIAEEQCCDAHVIDLCAGKTRVYAEALLDIVDLISEPPRRMRPAMCSGIGQRPLLQKRLVDLMRRRYVPTMTPLTRRAIMIAGAVSLLCHPALFVSEASTVGAATADAGRELIRRGLEELPESIPLPEAGLSSPVQPATTYQPQPGPVLPEPTEAERNEWATAISPNGRYHITVSRGYDCELREVTGNQVRRLVEHRVTCVAFAPDSARFVTGDLQGVVRVWDAASGEVLHTLTEREGAVYSVCVAPSGDQAVVAGEDGVVELISLIAPSDRQVLARLDAPVRCARFSPDGSRLAVVTDTWRTTAAATVAVYDVVSRARLLQWEVTGPTGAVDFPSRDRLLTIEWSGRARQWTLPGLYSIDLPPIAKELVSAASFSADSRVLEDLEQNTADTF